MVKKGIPAHRKLLARPKLQQFYFHSANRQQNKMHRYLPPNPILNIRTIIPTKRVSESDPVFDSENN